MKDAMKWSLTKLLFIWTPFHFKTIRTHITPFSSNACLKSNANEVGCIFIVKQCHDFVCEQSSSLQSKFQTTTQGTRSRKQVTNNELFKCATARAKKIPLSTLWIWGFFYYVKSDNEGSFQFHLTVRIVYLSS